jgi:hypothetical protein
MSTSAVPAPGDWRRIHALGLPAGSVRALLALIVFGTIWAWLLLNEDYEVPQYLQNLLFIIMGHYFAARHETKRDEAGGPPPLFLPVGSVRLILLGGFVAVAILLFQQDRVWIPHGDDAKIHKGALTLLLVAGFLIGVAVARLWSWWTGGARVPRWLEDVRAVISLAAAILLVLLVFNLINLDDLGLIQPFNQLAEGNGLKGSLAAIIGFYFGSRS